MTDPGRRQQQAVDEFLAVLRLERDGERWIGRTPDWGGPTVFGGVGLAMTISAACRDAPETKRLHSLHAHFLRPLQSAGEVDFTAEVLKAGRSFHLLHVTAAQHGKRAITATCSFTTDGEGYVYDASGIPDDVPTPDEIPAPVPEDDELWPWDDRFVGPSAPRGDGTRESTHRRRFRLPRMLDDDPHLQDVHALVNAGGRGTLRGAIRDIDGRIVVSMAQEMLLQPVERQARE